MRAQSAPVRLGFCRACGWTPDVIEDPKIVLALSANCGRFEPTWELPCLAKGIQERLFD